MKIWGMIPARMASSRFPNKPLARILGIPMIGHVYFRCKMSKALDDVFIATCDREIKEYADSIGAPCVMTSDTHQRAADRCAEAMLLVEKERSEKPDILVMIQGDEPMTRPEMIDQAISPLLNDPAIKIVNLMADIKSVAEFEDPNEVKVVVDKDDFALYFSREPIPSLKKGGKNVPMRKQVCIMPFRRDFLLEYNALPSTPLEIAESVDMMRILEHGGKVKMVWINQDTFSVDTLEDLKFVEGKMAMDPLLKLYSLVVGRA